MPKTKNPDDAQPTDKGGDGELTLEQQLEQAVRDRDKWKALARKHETRADSNADKAKKFDELSTKDDKGKTALDKFLERAEAAEKKLAEREKADELKRLRKEVAKEHGVEAKTLRGSTREEIEEHAAQLAEIYKVEKPPAPGTNAQGDRGSSVHTKGEKSAEEVVAAATGR